MLVFLKKFTNDEKRCMYVDIDYPLEPEYMAADGFHPRPHACSLWARHLAVMIHDRLDQKEKKTMTISIHKGSLCLLKLNASFL
ncbi:MAG: hypothetical protein BWX99_00949 [Deltaproteobacteria bacterium ADurb.Bin151]|jgi:hypothetical protein|nr:MAG: hypothetical protein BWX99_00949 [Deltaproteobacteria bacterium ADurb.Bin151]